MICKLEIEKTHFIRHVVVNIIQSYTEQYVNYNLLQDNTKVIIRPDTMKRNKIYNFSNNAGLFKIEPTIKRK